MSTNPLRIFGLPLAIFALAVISMFLLGIAELPR